MKKGYSTKMGMSVRMRGFSLIELMIAMILGLLVVAAAIGLFLSNRQAYSTTESLSRVQENARAAFELIARDIRDASGNACNSGQGMAMVNALNNPASRWWSDWRDGAIRGYAGTEAFPDAAFGTGAAQRINGTEAIVLLSGGNRTARVTAHDVGSAEFTVDSNAHGFSPGDVLMVCGPNSEVTGVLRIGAIFQMTGAGGGTAIGHAAGVATPGNRTANLGLDNGPFEFAANAIIANLHATRWYIGNNGRGGRSLYQSVLGSNGVVQNQEVVEGVDNMQLTYLLPGAGAAYSGAAAVAGNWNQVTAVRITFTQRSSDNTGVGGAPVQRTIASVVTLRNRNP